MQVIIKGDLNLHWCTSGRVRKRKKLLNRKYAPNIYNKMRSKILTIFGR
tara:strand:- start:672 stop:818 length:147 start_codon:yes stop_codon:yes gene_type:complete